MSRQLYILWLVAFLAPAVASCGVHFPFVDRDDKKKAGDEKRNDQQDDDADGQLPPVDQPQDDGGKGDDGEEHSEEPGGSGSEIYTMQNLFDATSRATAAFPRGLNDPEACAKSPAIRRGHDDIMNVASWRPPEYDLWVRVDYTNQCGNEPAKVYFWCHFHDSADGTKHIACHARGTATIDWDRLKEPVCKPPEECGGSDDDGDGGLPLP